MAKDKQKSNKTARHDQNWGGSRVGSGRPPNKTKAVAPPVQIRTQPQPIGNSLSADTAARRTVNQVTNSIPTNTDGFFGTRVSQQPRVVGYPDQPSAAPVQPPSTRTTIAQLKNEIAILAADNSTDGSTDIIFDESLGDGDGDGEGEGEADDSVNAEIAQKETEEAEVKILSENHQWLQTTLDQIVKDTNGRLKMSRCYKNGQFWVQPIDPVFALK
ncbi:hypothetical protein K438DRAFT_1770092 [Mycena galopus ATCC 62051]|nr:hypothetical protein K438DRAFT_1770092 [Mycena galopus ATCC 62051]